MNFAERELLQRSAPPTLPKAITGTVSRAALRSVARDGGRCNALRRSGMRGRLSRSGIVRERGGDGGVASDWAAALAGACDAVLCSPPYVRSADIARLAPEIAWEPRCALDGGADGLDSFRAVTGGAARLLAVDGVAAFEIGDGQVRAVGDLLRAAGFGAIVEHRDLSGAVRCLSARRGLRQPI